MTSPTVALFDFITDSAPVAALIGTYAGAPAVFEERAPDGFQINEPVVIIDPPISAPRSDSSTHITRRMSINIRVYTRVVTDAGATGYAALEAASEALSDLLHNAAPPIAGAQTVRLAAAGPVFAPTDSPLLGGRLISLQWTITTRRA